MIKRLTSKKIKPKKYVSEKITLNVSKLENDFYRADLIIHGLDHSRASYEGRVFINNPDADNETPDDPSQGYAGSFFVFGHGGCLGSSGHCDVYRPTIRFNMIPNVLIPERVSLIITDTLRRLAKYTNEFSFTIVPRLAGGSENVCQKDADLENVVSLSRLSIETYDEDE